MRLLSARRLVWLGDRRGDAADWLTQRWVWATGRRADLDAAPWLDAPVGRTTGIGAGFYDELARAHGLEVRHGGAPRGLLRSLDELAGPGFDPARVHPSVAAFYARTSAYAMEAQAEWRRPFRPLGWVLALVFSRRLGQMNVPLSPDEARGETSSEVVHLVDPATGAVRHAAWVRTLARTGRVLYAGTYGAVRVPGLGRPCVRAAFPLPNGNALVVLRPDVGAGGTLTLTSRGRRFGDPGFYFTVHAPDGRVRARYVRTMHETLRLYPDGGDAVRAEHEFTIWGVTFLRFRYHLRPRA